MREVTIEVKRRIAVGKKYHIAPTMAFLGVLPGIIEVLEIGYKDEIITAEAQVSIECYIDAFGDEEGDWVQEEIEGIWVSYEYTDSTEEGVNAFPISEFLRHTSEYI